MQVLSGVEVDALWFRCWNFRLHLRTAHNSQRSYCPQSFWAISLEVATYSIRSARLVDAYSGGASTEVPAPSTGFEPACIQLPFHRIRSPRGYEGLMFFGK